MWGILAQLKELQAEADALRAALLEITKTHPSATSSTEPVAIARIALQTSDDTREQRKAKR